MAGDRLTRSMFWASISVWTAACAIVGWVAFERQPLATVRAWLSLALIYAFGLVLAGALSRVRRDLVRGVEPALGAPRLTALAGNLLVALASVVLVFLHLFRLWP